jgi:hypothetical protein
MALTFQPAQTARSRADVTDKRLTRPARLVNEFVNETRCNGRDGEERGVPPSTDTPLGPAAMRLTDVGETTTG